MKKAKSGQRNNARSAARLAAVQALYQMDVAGTTIEAVIEEFLTHRINEATEDGERPASGADEGERPDGTFFAEIMRGVVRRQRDVDPMIDQQLATGWRLERVDSILRAILRAGTLELLERPDVPARVVISEYIDVAHAFFEGDEPRVVNGVLDKLGRKVRPAEFEPKPGDGRSSDQDP